MELLSDVVFGNGVSVPGGEDISVLCDNYGFPYYKGSTFKGVFREELYRYLEWTGCKDTEEKVNGLLGRSGDSSTVDTSKVTFSDFMLSEYVKKIVLEEINDNMCEVTNSFTNIRAFTRIDDDGIAEKGTLRYCRCVNKGLVFYSEICCRDEDRELIENVNSLIKWIGTMRNRGFGKVRISTVKED